MGMGCKNENWVIGKSQEGGITDGTASQWKLCNAM